MAGQWIEIPAGDGGSFRGYLASPASGKGPGIVLCQEIFGINEYIRDVADYYAEEGYVVLAPDLFWRIKPGIELAQPVVGLQERPLGGVHGVVGVPRHP